jgi:hypothetical protein
MALVAVHGRSEPQRFQVVFDGSRGVLTLDYKLPVRDSTQLARLLPAGWTHVCGQLAGPRDHRRSHTIRGGARAIIRTVGGIDVELGGRKASKYALHTSMPNIHPGDDIAGEEDECACAWPSRCGKCQIKPGGKVSCVDVAYYLDMPKLYLELAAVGASLTSFQWRCVRGFRGIGGEWEVSEDADGLSCLVQGNGHSYRHGFSEPLAEAFNISSPFGELRVECSILWGYRTKLYDLTVTTVSVCAPRVIADAREVADEVLKVATYDPASAVAALLRSKQSSDVYLEDAVASAYGSALRVARAHASARAGLSRRDRALMDNYEMFRVGVTRVLRLSMYQEIVCFLGDVVDVTPDVVGDIVSLEEVKSTAQALIDWWWLVIIVNALIRKYGGWRWALCLAGVMECARFVVVYYVHLRARLSV